MSIFFFRISGWWATEFELNATKAESKTHQQFDNQNTVTHCAFQKHEKTDLHTLHSGNANAEPFPSPHPYLCVVDLLHSTVATAFTPSWYMVRDCVYSPHT